MISFSVTSWVLDNVLDASGWPTYTGRSDGCPVTMAEVPGSIWRRVRAAGIKVADRCVMVSPMCPVDWEQLMDELTQAAPAVLEIEQRGLIFENELPGYFWPERFLLGLTIVRKELP